MKRFMARLWNHHLARTTASLVATAALFGIVSGVAQASGEIQHDMAVTSVSMMDPALRPAGVPSDYVVTPNGFFPASCVQVVHANENLLADGSITRVDGALRKPAGCTQAHYTSRGTRVEPDGRISQLAEARSNPTINSWVIDTNYSSSVAIGRIVASWKVPTAPSSKSSQIDYFFPGLEQSASGSQSILQPVLAWNGFNDKAWTMTGWNCCVDGTTYHGDTISVSAGDSIVGDTYSTCAAGVSCSTWAILSSDTTKGTSTTFKTNPYAALTWVFGGVLEAYNISTCSQYPASGSISFTNIAVYNLNKVQIASPPWTKDYPVGSTSPQCNYGITATSAATTLVF